MTVKLKFTLEDFGNFTRHISAFAFEYLQKNRYQLGQHFLTALLHMESNQIVAIRSKSKT